MPKKSTSASSTTTTRKPGKETDGWTKVIGAWQQSECPVCGVDPPNWGFGPNILTIGTQDFLTLVCKNCGYNRFVDYHFVTSYGTTIRARKRAEPRQA